jgi:hypothetical protein
MAARLEGKSKEQYADVRRRIDELTKRLDQEREREEIGPRARVAVSPPQSGNPVGVFVKPAFALAMAAGVFLYWQLH